MPEKVISGTSLVILGTIQDAGSPHIACKKKCCQNLFKVPDKGRKVVSLGLIDAENNKNYLFEATPDITEQMKKLMSADTSEGKELADGIFLTHAHIGHYTGLMYLGKEAVSADSVPVFAMPKMKIFLEQNGPWSQLVTNSNISIQEINNKKEITLSSSLHVIPFTVPHRDEFSETVGYQIVSKNKKIIFIPDIDKWGKWKKNIIEVVKNSDHVLIDATFYQNKEVKGRDMSEIPHPFVEESMSLFKDLSFEEKNKIIFIHFNHSNPLLNPKSKESKHVESLGFKLARQLDVISL
ncbi:MAG TPA: pyrroloquinoline quinone biosynthesis protein PqqB [Bacteroidetes bacterium]|nr:pyrroloquinoline quinone biosynthesis protein PqqB [Bacteroidota bacterium]